MHFSFAVLAASLFATATAGPEGRFWFSDCHDACLKELTPLVKEQCPMPLLQTKCVCAQLPFQKAVFGCIEEKCTPGDAKDSLATLIDTCTVAFSNRNEEWINPFAAETLLYANVTSNGTAIDKLSGASDVKAGVLVVAAAALFAML